jgi:hypothetical protein
MHDTQGILSGMLDLLKVSFCKKTLDVDGPACQTIFTTAMAAWPLKCLVGLLSDMYPLCGYHKRSYLLLSCAAGVPALVALATLNLRVVGEIAVSSLLLLVNVQVSTCDVLCEAQYARQMQSRPESGSSMVSFVWGCFQAGGIIAALFVGPLADSYDPQICFWICIPLAGSIIVPTLLGFLQDEAVEPQESTKAALFDSHRSVVYFRHYDPFCTRIPAYEPLFLACALFFFAYVDYSVRNEALLLAHVPSFARRQRWHVVHFSFAMASLAVGNTVLDIAFFPLHLLQMCYALVTSVVLCVLAFLWLPPHLARCMVYLFVGNALYLNLNGALDFWCDAPTAGAPS